MFTKADGQEHKWGAVCSEGHGLPGKMRRDESLELTGIFEDRGPALVIFAALSGVWCMWIFSKCLLDQWMDN